MKKNSIVLFTTALLFAFAGISCDKKGNPVTDGKIYIIASENPVTIAIGYFKYVSLTGGTGTYRIVSNSDSTIVAASVLRSQQFEELQLRGDKIGNTKIVIEDSAKTAQVEIFVTVQIMAASSSSITVRPNRTRRYIYINGGTSPYSISSPPNSAVATASLSGSSLDITGVSPGQTSVTVSDNASPKNSVTISITVPVPPSFTTAGKIAFTSTVGSMNIEGLYGANDPNTLPANDVGAGGFVLKFGTFGNLSQLIGYKKKTPTKMDIVLIIFSKSTISPETISLDTSTSVPRNNFGQILFSFDAEMNDIMNIGYLSHNGTLEITQFSEQKIAGKFSGSASQLGPNGPLPGNNVPFSQGVFDMPVLIDDFDLATTHTALESALFSHIEKMIQPYRKQIMKEMEKKMKR